MNESEYERSLERERARKDEFFANHPQSPIPHEDRSEFKGLDHFPPNREYRFELELQEHQDREIIGMAYTGGEEQEFVRWGQFRFTVHGSSQTLQVYKSDQAEERLFLLFKDATSGKETQGAGRYLDLNAESDKTPGGNWILDFNRAYNPWCVYSENFTCPFVPPENWLDIPVYAGEKNYALKGEAS